MYGELPIIVRSATTVERPAASIAATLKIFGLRCFLVDAPRLFSGLIRNEIDKYLSETNGQPLSFTVCCHPTHTDFPAMAPTLIHTWKFPHPAKGKTKCAVCGGEDELVRKNRNPPATQRHTNDQILGRDNRPTTWSRPQVFL